jgi:molybdopterin converting factor small subunit
MAQTYGDPIHLRIVVEYSRPFCAEAGVKEETYEIDQESITLAGVLDLIASRHPSLSRFMDKSSEEAQRRQLSVAIDSRLVRLSDGVYDGDTVSILLPVIGG